MAPPDLPDARGHPALYTHGEPTKSDLHTGLFCWCGREVVSTMGDDCDHPSGWCHVGVGCESDGGIA